MDTKKKAQVSNLDSILIELGQFGKYQLMNYALLVVPVIFAAFNNGNYIFTAVEESHRCFVPECETTNTTLAADWLHYAMPFSNESRRCSRYGPSESSSRIEEYSNCSASAFDHNTVIDCDEWVFGDGNSIVKELGIQCQSWKRTLVGTVHSLGLLFALPLVSFVSDKYGRRVALVSSAFSAGVLGLVRSFSTNYIMFLVFEFLEPAFGSGVYSSGFILGMELVGPKRRVLGATILCMFYSTGAMLLGALAWLMPYWRNLLRLIYIPSLLFISYFWLIQESVRWLISKGKYDKAIKILKDAAKTNGVTLTDKSMESLYTNVENNQADIEMKPVQEEVVEKEESAIKQVLKSPIILFRLLRCSFWWITCTFVYYGLSINSVSLTGSIYLNYVLVSSVELPAYFTGFLVLDRYGRKYTLFSAFILSGIACSAFPFIPADAKWISLVTYLFGNYFITLAFGSLYVYTSELFPTLLRHSLLGTCSMIGRIGSIIAPQTPLLAEFVPGLPSFLFGGMSIMAGILMLSSPETLNIKLPDTIQDAENIAKKKTPKT